MNQSSWRRICVVSTTCCQLSAQQMLRHLFLVNTLLLITLYKNASGFDVKESFGTLRHCSRPPLLKALFTTSRLRRAEYIKQANCEPKSASSIGTSLSSATTQYDHDSSFVDGLATTFRPLFWLDLRETSISPREALKFLQDNIFDDHTYSNDDVSIHDIVDLVVTSDFDKATNSLAETNLDFMYEVSNNGQRQLALSRKDTQQSFIAGRILSCTTNDVLDPMSALDTLSQNRWLFVEVQKSNYPNDMSTWIETQVSGLIMFLKSSSTSQKITSPSGLIVPNNLDQSSNADVPVNETNGGVAITCHTRSALFQLATILATIFGNDASTTISTESGILLPSFNDNNSNSIDELKARSKPTMSTAIVLPLDLQLWKTVLDLYISNLLEERF